MSEWTSPAQPVRCIVDLTAPLTVRRERGVLVQGDKNANAIVAEVYSANDVPYDLTGSTVTLTFVRPDKLAAPPISAEITGNVAVMTLTDTCYRVSGMYAASVELHNGEMDRTIVRMLGDIISAENDGTVTDEQLLPTPEELLVMLEQVEQARNDANTAAENAKNATIRANEATKKAEDSASAIENVTASATGLETGAAPTVEVTNNSGGKHFAFGIPKGEKGDKGDPGSIENVSIGSIAGLPEALNGKLPINGIAADSAMLGGKPPEYYLPAVDLLDNSDFTNPVYLAGIGGMHGVDIYALDRWLYNGTADQLVLSGGIGLSYAVARTIYQRLGRCNILDGHNYTLVVWTGDGVAHCVRVTPGYTMVGASGYAACHNGENTIYIQNVGAALPIAHVALYRIAYTADIRPPYVPKGYTAELAECLRYYQPPRVIMVQAYAAGFLPNQPLLWPTRTVPVISDITCTDLLGGVIAATYYVGATQYSSGIFSAPSVTGGQWVNLSFAVNNDL